MSLPKNLAMSLAKSLPISLAKFSFEFSEEFSHDFSEVFREMRLLNYSFELIELLLTYKTKKRSGIL